MSARLIDGKVIAQKTLDDCREDIAALRARGITPGLAVVLVGRDPASTFYVRQKDKKCQELGLHSVKWELPEETSEEELLDRIGELNRDPSIHGILVQSPPPPHIDEAKVIRAIDPAKDVDGFHPVNVGKLAQEDPTGFVPCTPLGCQKLLAEAGVETAGAEVVVVGRSLIVGKPMALLLMAKGPTANATVTLAHSRTRDLPEVVGRADIVVAAIGRPEFVRGAWIKEGAVVIDVGINRVDDPSTAKGYRIVGDVEFEAARARASAITPVPGGVGPMTIAMLLANTIKSAKLKAAADSTRGGEEGR